MHGWRKLACWSLIAVAGCQSARKTPYADNPLLLSREPLLQAPTPVGKPSPPASMAKSKLAIPATPTDHLLPYSCGPPA